MISGKLAELLDADLLMILTNEDQVCIQYRSEHPQPLFHVTADEIKTHIANQEFGENAMLPKMVASVAFVSKKPGKTAIITSIDAAMDALHDKTGTIITA